MAQEKLTLPTALLADGEITPPGSKSISNRVLPLAALAKGNTRIFNLLHSEDVEFMSSALRQLGVTLQWEEGYCTVNGMGRPFHSSHSSTLPQRIFLGNSGTSTRILTALLAASEGNFMVDGVPRMRERPIGDLVKALERLAGETKIHFESLPGFPPLRIEAKGLEGGSTSIKGDISSQFLTGLLMALPLCRRNAEATLEGKLVSRPYVELTLKMMQDFGARVENRDWNAFQVKNPDGYLSPGEYHVESDASSASYFMAAGAIAGGEVTVHGISHDSLQGEARFADVLERMGARVRRSGGSITVGKGSLQGLDVDMDEMTDTGMTLAVTALFARGPTIIRNIGNWRMKETDRIKAMATELRKVGAQVEEGLDYLVIQPPKEIESAEIETYQDHRIAMCFSLLCLGGRPVTILDPGCTAKTFPGYFEQFGKIVR